MKVFYTRVSTHEQNPERQLQNLKGFDYILSDKCSGLIPLFERPQGSQIKKLMDQGLKHLEIHSIDRLGRDLLSCLNVWSELTNRGITIVCRNPNLRNIDVHGKKDKFSELMMSILSTLSSFEKQLIKERQLEGIKIRKEKGLYKGRRINSKDTPDKFLSKERTKKILEYLNKGTHSYNEISKILGVSPSTIVKTKKIYDQSLKVR